MSYIVASLIALANPVEQSQIVWKWKQDDIGCVLRQDLADGRFLEVGGSPASDDAGIAIVDSARIRSWKPLKAVEVLFAPGGTVKLDGFVGPYKDPSGRRIGVGFSREDFLRFSNASNLTLSHPEFGTLRVPVRSPAAAVHAIRTCEDKKMSEWGIDPVAWRALPVKPTPKTPRETWLSWLDYPDRQKIYKNDIDVVARLDVGVDGSVQGCTVVNRPPAEFIEAACQALRRNAKLQPARDASGKGTPAPYIVHVRFGAYLL